MDREIKFRAWDVRHGKMWIHDYSKEGDYTFDKMNSVGGYYYNYGVDQIDDFILMQYTELKDKNGVEIYEGDIIEVPHIVGVGFYTIIWEKGSLGLRMERRFWRLNAFTVGWDETALKVVGNIHENPELLIKDKQTKGEV